ncbi:MAG: hypothetical protein WEA81_04655 [Dehalococcoidia bacterium]
MSNALTFPSVEWFQALADITKADPNYRKFGRLNAIVVFKSGDQLIQVNFNVLDIMDITEVGESALRDADFIIEMTPQQWKDMLDDIKQRGHAGLEQTLNTLDLEWDEPIHRNDLEDGYKADLFFRYLPSLQVMFDNSSQLETVYSPLVSA